MRSEASGAAHARGEAPGEEAPSFPDYHGFGSCVAGWAERIGAALRGAGDRRGGPDLGGGHHLHPYARGLALPGCGPDLASLRVVGMGDEEYAGPLAGYRRASDGVAPEGPGSRGASRLRPASTRARTTAISSLSTA